MKHLNGKQKNKSSQKRKKTSQKPGFSNSGKSYQIIHKNLRSRCIGENEASIITHKMRSYQVENEVPLMRSHQIEKLQRVNTETLNFYPELKSTKHYTGLNTSKNKAVICSVYNGIPEIYVDDPVGNQDRGSLSVDFFTYRTSNEDNLSSSVVGLKLRHSDTDFQVLANDKNIELHKSESQNSAQENKYFILHQNSELVSFECLKSQGLYIGVEEDQLKLMEKKEDDEAFMFQLLTE
ncbi:interleukin-33-like [Vombatus ursinus]|uniref:interleukin-33-like n=1 Tax=Vombatus ursinus TaxID=29139 RepID=UPI000FFD512E|nr:interleukin-33-like [Vombatus ursinus]XP_027718944.1 interleukin-33-like [Vombatus ursinus]XP_027718945.1 interleukin-33-like [Vombatus ursinus]XP_027718946.1 interleukin-33-like [Vombatus ursinus]XP_027718947.1 interleukin-33-like [Vombatus ursinus]XP_027718948.1 interleukin-33-like [Vombatus ursinus]XP_027718949.1 interleukin-33-like [Vombatus ursinus]